MTIKANKDGFTHSSPRSKPSMAPKHSHDYPTRPEQQPLTMQSFRVLALPSLAFAGVQLAWAVQIGHATAHLRKLGLSDKLVGLAWLAGPVTGIFVQPAVGVLSDRCTSRMGRRRPFMILGSILVAITLLLFAGAGNVASALGDPISVNGGGSKTALGVALTAFWFLDFSINVLQTPLRAYLGDVVPPDQIPTGNSFFAVANGFGKAVGYGVGFAFAANIQTISIISTFAILVLTLIPVAFMHERAVTSAEVAAPVALDESPENRASIPAEMRYLVKETKAALRALPRGIRKVFLAQWFTYLSFILLFIYYSDWVGLEVMGGDADAPPSSAAHERFTSGVKLANKGLLAMSIMSMLFSPVVPVLARTVGTRTLWGSSLGMLGFALVSSLLRPGQGGALFIAICVALPMSTAFTIPWAIASLTLRGQLGQQRGLYLAIFNMSQATPGVVASGFGGIIIHLGKGRLSAVLATAGVSAFIATIAVMFVEIPKEMIHDTDAYIAKRKNNVSSSRCIGCFPVDAASSAVKMSGSGELKERKQSIDSEKKDAL